MSKKRSTGKDQSDKNNRNGEINSRVDSPLRDNPHSAKIHHTKLPKIKHERPLTSSNRHPQSEKSDNPRVKSSRPGHRDSAGQDPPSAAQNRRVKSSQDGRTSIDVEASEVEQHRETDDEDSESTSPKRTNENKTPSPATRPLSRPSQNKQGLGRRFGGSNQQQPYVLESDLRRGSNYYLYCLGKIYDVSDMRRRKELQYWNLLARQRQLGFHSAKECEVYMRYLSRPRTADIYSTPTHSSKSRTRSTEGRRGRGAEAVGRCGVATDGKKRTMAVNEEKDEKESSGDYKVKPARSKARPVSSKTSERRPANSKTNLVNSKTSKPSSKTRLDSSKKVNQREVDNQRSVSRDEDEDKDEEKKKKGSKETSDEESETSENDEDKTRNRRNSRRGKDKRTEGEQKPSDALLSSKAADAENDGDEEETSDGDESEGRSKTQRDGGNKPVDATNRDGRNTEVASSDEGGSDSGGR